MTRGPALRRSARAPVLLDLAAILIFVTIGLAAHGRGIALRGYLRDALPLAGGWFAAAALFRLYSRPRWRALALTWICGIPLGVLARALVLGRVRSPSEAAFLAVCLVTIGALVLAGRGGLRLAGALGWPRAGRTVAASTPAANASLTPSGRASGPS